METTGKTLKFLLLAILLFSFLVRVAGIGYGLPMWLVDDEPPFALAALKMIQLKNPIPAFNLEEFKTVLYYPPYLAYAYILPFLVLLAAKFFTFAGEASQFIYYLTSDLSSFFLAARFLNVLIATVSVWLAYDIARSLFKDKAAGWAAAFFLATSLSHIMFSFVGRHWLAVSFLYLLGFWLLNKENWGWEKRYVAAVLVAGFGMGVSPIVSLFLVLVAVWYLFYEKRSVWDLFKSRYFYFSGISLVVLTVLPSIFYPASFGFRGDITFNETKSFIGLLASPIQALKPVIFAEPILTFFAAAGILLALFRQRIIFWPFLVFFYGYAGIFYWLFRFEHRFILPLVPFLAILAGFALSRIKKPVFLFLLVLPLIASVRLGYLAYQNDSRIHLRNWIMENLPENSKILVYARLTRLPSNKEAITELRSIDPSALRKVDAAEENLTVREEKYFHALNLYSVSSESPFDSLEDYARKNQYEYLLLSNADFANRPERFRHFQELAKNGVLLKSFGATQESYSLAIGQLLGSPGFLFKLKEFGPAVSVYKISP